MSCGKDQRPEWAPPQAGDEFASRVRGPAELSPAAEPRPAPRRRVLSTREHVQGVLTGDRAILARTITLVESNSPQHRAQAQQVLQEMLPHAGRAVRVGVTGYPGAGKSTFIEALGNLLCEQGRKVAVLAVDPSSSLTRGSILGDKTRMAGLSRQPLAYIRPSPSGGVLGGVARKSRETMLVCEAAGFEIILVETVGVGQSEVAVRGMVDFFLLVMIAGAGDELQGLKKGIMELCDAILINKADGDNRTRALATRAEFERVLHYLQPATPGWRTQALACSSIGKQGIDQVWATIEQFMEQTRRSGMHHQRRQQQDLDWMHSMVREHLETSFHQHPQVQAALPAIEKAVRQGELSPAMAAEKLLSMYRGG